MKKILVLLIVLSSFCASAQVKISAMPYWSGSMDSAYVPIVVNLVNYKTLGSRINQTRIDSIVLNWPSAGLTRFGVSGEDDVAGETRLFNLGDHIFSIATGVSSEDLTYLKGSFNVWAADGATPTNRAGYQAIASSGIQTTANMLANFSGSHTAEFTTLANSSSSYLHMNLGSDPKWDVVGLGTGTYANVLYYDDGTGDIKWGAAPAGGGGSGIQSIEGNNGVTVLTDSIVQLGSTSNSGVPLTASRFINTSTFTLNVRGSSTNDVLDVITTHATAYALKADAIGGAAIRAANLPGDVNTIKPVIEVVRAGTGSASAGIGAGIDYYTWIDNTNGSTYNGTIAAKWTNTTYATRTSNLEFFATDNAVTNNVVSMEGGGNLKLNVTGKGYSLKSPDGTVWYITISNAGVLSTSTTAP